MWVKISNRPDGDETQKSRSVCYTEKSQSRMHKSSWNFWESFGGFSLNDHPYKCVVCTRWCERAREREREEGALDRKEESGWKGERTQPLLIIIDGQKEWSSQALIGRPVNEVLARLCTLNTSRQKIEKPNGEYYTRASPRLCSALMLPHALRPPFVVFSACVCTRFLINVPVSRHRGS